MSDRIIELVSLFESNETEYLKSTYNEQECRLEFIDSLLECLGWDVKNNKHNHPACKEVMVEKYVQNMKRPDYTMTFHGFNKFFVEAKKPSVDISSDSEPAFQARRYGWNAKHNLVVLTNFKDLYIYDTSVMPVSTDSVNTCLIKKYHYTEYVEKFDEISNLIGREFVYSGMYDEHFLNTRIDPMLFTVDKAFLQEINQWRVQLANNLYRNDKDKYSNTEVLNDEIQNFINRLVFLRICEDRNLTTYFELFKATEDQNSVKNKLNLLFKKSDEQYNSGLFSDDGIIFDLNNEIVLDIVKKLYYPQSPYLFNIIETNILGQIYEIFLTEKLEIDPNDEIVLAKKIECKDKSVVTTPIGVVDTILDKCLPIEISSFNDLRSYRVIDIACGSGIFLEEAFKKICDKFFEWCEKNKDEYLEYTSNGDRKLKYEIKKEILKKCIYGVDIDPRAVEVCKFSLLIKLLENESDVSLLNEHPILPNIDNNICCGNSLIEYGDVQESTDEDLIKINPFNWTNGTFSSNYDCVVGNPPYVKTEDIHAFNSKYEFDAYKKLYKSAYKQFDKYFLFVEKALSILKDGGRFGMIIPNKFMKIESAKFLRNILSDGKYNIDIVDFGSSQVFEDKTIYSSLLFVKKTDENLTEYSRCNSVEDLLRKKVYNHIETNTNGLGNDVWPFSALYNKTHSEGFVNLTKKAYVYNGIQTSMENPHVYWISDDQIVSETSDIITFNFNNGQYAVEKSILRPYFKPINNQQKGCTSYDLLSTDKRIIYPYDSNGNLYDIDTMRNLYPNCFNYLSAYYNLLVPKQVDPRGIRDVPNATSENWYQYGRVQGLTAFNNRKKIIVKNMFKIPMFAYDENNMILQSGGTAGYSAVSAREDVLNKYSIEFIQAWLTSDLTTSIFRDIASQFEGGFYAIGTSKLKKIQIADLNFDNKIDKENHDTITTLMKEIRITQRKISSLRRRCEISALKLKLESQICEVNDIIKQIYERKLGTNEIKE